MRACKISVGVSGGVDSAAAVKILKQQGYEVRGVTFSVMGEDISESQQQLSDKLSIDIDTIDISNSFKNQIIEPFIDSYMLGSTPSPCVECNCSVKWQVIEQHALEHGASLWATGHYVQKVEHNGLFYIAKGIDPLKDQSYYLWKLSQSTLKGAVMPLGDKTKAQIKDFMSKNGHTELSSKKESMGVCFLGKGGYKELLKNSVKDIDRLLNGEIVDLKGRVIGSHDGYPFYTLAQRKGLPIERPYCVVDIDPHTNRLIIGTDDDLYTDTIYIERFSFVSIDEVIESKILRVKVRGIGRNPQGYCKIEFCDDNLIKVKLLTDKAWAVTKGQPVVFYIENRVVGGGYANL